MKHQKSRNFHFIYALLDVIVVFGVTMISFLAHYGFDDFSANMVPCFIYAASVASLTFVVFFFTKTYRIITTNFGLFESLRIMVVVLAIHLVGLVVIALVPQLLSFRDYFFSWALATVSLVFIHSFIRMVVRVVYTAYVMSRKQDAVRTIVIGAGATGKVVVDESRRNENNHNKIVAIVDDDAHKIGGFFANLPIEGPISNIADIIEKYNAEEVIVAMSKISEDRLHEILSYLNNCDVRVRRMPLISEMEGPNDKRIIEVDLDDLLSRDPVVLDNHEVYDMLHGKVVMVTGAGGSIGSELVRQIFRTHPSTLVLFDIYENSTYNIQMELNRWIREEEIKDVKLVTLIGSTYNEFRVEQIIKKYRPDYIYHAAAYKHVPLMEDSPAEAIRTNVIGTYNVAKMADKYGVKKMVLVSTDKAVRPTNVMGATKRFAETIIQYFSAKSKGTKYAAVRFGNVLGSNGSVVPLFEREIATGGPVTITDKNIIRYFMTIPEAVSLILQCGLFAKDGEIFILDMGKPVKIIELAERLIRQAGLVPYVDIDIVEIGLRPGEKLYEELLLDTKHQQKTANKKIYIEPKESVNEKIEQDVSTASQVFSMEETSDVKHLLAQLINTYKVDERTETDSQKSKKRSKKK